MVAILLQVRSTIDCITGAIGTLCLPREQSWQKDQTARPINSKSSQALLGFDKGWYVPLGVTMGKGVLPNRGGTQWCAPSRIARQGHLDQWSGCPALVAEAHSPIDPILYWSVVLALITLSTLCLPFCWVLKTLEMQLLKKGVFSRDNKILTTKLATVYI